MSSTANTRFDAARDEVDVLVNAGEHFESIEAMIDDAPLSGDEKAALWLLAWSEQPDSQRRQIVGEALAAATA